MLNLLKVGTGSVSAEDAQQFVRYLMGEAELQRSSKRASISDLKSMGISVEILVMTTVSFLQALPMNSIPEKAGGYTRARLAVTRATKISGWRRVECLQWERKIGKSGRTTLREWGRG